MLDSESEFKIKIVQLILAKDSDEAVKVLSQHYGVGVPHLRVGMPKKHGGKIGCYVSKTRTIHVMNQEMLGDPFVIIHEFYHHLRTQGREHKGTEKNADKFAGEFIEAFKALHRYSFRVSYKYGE